MDRLDALRAFLAVAEKRSFSGAGSSLRMSPAAVSRAVSSLEADLGVALFHRTTRSVTLTSEGAVYSERCRQALEELAEGRRLLSGGRSEPHGILVVNAPVVFGRLHVLPIVSRMLRTYPRLDVRLTLVNRKVRLAEEGVDVAVRIADLPDSTLHAVRVGEVRRVVVASPAYLSERGTPAEPAQLHGHDLIALEGMSVGTEWRFGVDGRPVIRFQARLSTNSVEAAVDAAIEGIGIARPLSYQVDRALGEGRLVAILSQFNPPPLPISLVYPANRRGSANVRALIEAARSYFGSNPLRTA